MLSGCASLFKIDADDSNTPKYSIPKKIDQEFDISGRFTVNSARVHKYGNFNWVKMIDHETIEFNTPLGQTVAKIDIIGANATLTTKDHVYTSDDLDQLMQEKLGFVLPIKYLHYWVQGVKLPDVAVTQNLANGFVQMGWKVEYLQWQDNNHPQIIRLTHDDLVVKLLINW